MDLNLNIRARVIPIYKVELDAPDFKPTPRKPCNDPSKSNNKATVVDVSSLLTDNEVFLKVSMFLIDLFEFSEDPYVFYSLCQYAGQKYIPMDIFINAVKSDCDCVDIIKIDSLGEVNDCFKKYLPNYRQRSVTNRDEVWQFISLGLMSLSKFPEFKNTSKFLQYQLKHLSVKPNNSNVALRMTPKLFAKLSRQAFAKKDTCNTRVIIVKWVIEVKKYRKYLDEVCKQWKGAQMTHILLIKNEIWEKRGNIIQELKEKHSDMLAVIHEIDIFETIVMSHSEYEHFDYMKLIQTKNIFQGASTRDLPIFMHVAVELAKSSSSSLQNFVLLELDAGRGVIKDFLLTLARKSVGSRAAIKPQVNKKKGQLRVETDQFATAKQQRQQRKEGGSKKKSNY